MALITLRNVRVSYGRPLLDGVTVSLDKGERVSLIGRNGAGKSTLMKVIDGEITADDGDIIRMEGLRVAKLDQEVPLGTSGRVFDVIASGLGAIGHVVSRFHALSSGGDTTNPNALAELDRCQHALEAAGAWALHNRVSTLVTRINLPETADINELSGGLKRRVLLARALVNEPDLLLLDEPTNHLDLDAILWLEEFLLGWSGALLFVSHDRAFLQRLATRIIELDRGNLYDWPGDYANYERRKEEQLHAEAKQQAEFDKRLAQEEAWIREGIKARRTRNMGRVRRLYDMRRELSERRIAMGQVKLGIQRGDQSGKLVFETESAEFKYGDRTIIRDLSTTILRGDKVGIIGPNGSGKTTLLRLLLRELVPTRGTVRQGTNLKVAYFDQYRAQLDENLSVIDNLANGSDRVTFQDRNVHVISYLKDFLFTADRARQPVSALSGGERNRLLLAKLFTQPANLLVMDEPTNDLDAETLDLLEELLIDFTGTLLLVSHDRAFLNNVATSVLAFEGNGIVREYIG